MPGWAARGEARVPRLTETPTRTLKLTISYDGTRFVGWQRQAAGVSIQGLLEDALARFDRAPVAVQGAGRTDAGVHALGQVASVEMTSMHPLDSVARGLNAYLPPDVRVIDIQEVAADFHARFSARSKTYRYQLQRSVIASPFERAYVWHVPEALDVDAMRVAAHMLVGTHDFAAFQSTGSDTKSTVRTISQSAIGERAVEGWPESTAPLLVYEVSGDGFLRHMVRAIVGTLVEVGRGQRREASIAALLAGGSRSQAGITAPAQGLFMVRVVYD